MIPRIVAYQPLSPDAAQQREGLDWLDIGLIGIFLLGIYSGVAIQFTSQIPLPSAPSGFAGLVMLWRRRDQIVPVHLGALLVVMLAYLGSILSAADYAYLAKRFTGFVQISYSLVIGYAMFLTMIRAQRRQLAGIFLGFCLVIAVGCLLETYGGLHDFSDMVRHHIYDYGIYDSDLRDELLYGRVRPKFFTSEPSAVTFAYTLFGFAWLMFSEWRRKVIGYLMLVAIGLVAMPGPTLLLMLVLVVPYELCLAGRTGTPSPHGGRMIVIGILSVVAIAAAFYLGNSIYAERLRAISNGNDPSFFYRVIGPMLVAFDVMHRHPWAGAGLTGEAFIQDEVMNAFVRSAEFSPGWIIHKVADVLTNYFWQHWIYLGLVWGILVAAALTVWLRLLDVPSAFFCWLVWAILGQASGSYVGPKTWAVLLLAGAGALLNRSAPVRGDATFAAPGAIRPRPAPPYFAHRLPYRP